MRAVIFCWISVLFLVGCVTTTERASSDVTPEPNREILSFGQGKGPRGRTGDALLNPPVGGPYSSAVLAMEWPQEIAPDRPPARRKTQQSPGADAGFRQFLELHETADTYGHSIDPDLAKLLRSPVRVPMILTALDFTLARNFDDPLATQFLYLYAELLATKTPNVDTVAAATMAADIASMIDVARCASGPEDPMLGVWSRRREHRDVYAVTQRLLNRADAATRARVAYIALRMEKSSAAVRKDAALCRHGPPYATSTTCSEDKSGSFPITRCESAGDDKSVPTNWARDDEAWRKRRIALLTQLTPEKIIETYSKPPLQMLP